MFTWICPKCGGEVPPSYNECPRCTGQTAAAASPPPVAPVAVSKPEPVPQTPPPPVAAAPPVAPPPPPVAPPEPVAHRQRALSPALVAVVAAIAIVGLLAVLYFWVLPRKPVETAGTQAPLSTPTTARSGHPLAKHLEVVGVRIVENSGGTAKIQLLVVNHSAADLPEMKMDVTLRAADREVFEFPLTLPSLGPYEFRELTTTVRTDLKPYELPDWQVIRPEFRLTSEP